MKSMFKRSTPDGTLVATVTVDIDSVTVTKKEDGSRSIGRPLRIPTKHCRDSSPVAEGEAQCQILLEDGFELSGTDGADSSGARGKVLYLSIAAKSVPMAIECVTAGEVPSGITLHTRPGGVVRVCDTANQVLTLDPVRDSAAVVQVKSALAAVALLLCQRGYASLVHESVQGQPNGREVTSADLHIIASSLDANLFQYLEGQGIHPAGVVQTASVTSAVLL